MDKTRRLLLAVWLVAVLWLVALPVQADNGGDAVFGQDYTLSPGQKLTNDLTVFGGRVMLDQDTTVEGNVVIMGGEATLKGNVLGDVVVMGGSVELGATAVVGKDLVVFGQVRRHPDAKIKGNVVEGADATRGLKYLPEMLKIKPGAVPASPAAARPSSSGVLGWFGRLLGALAATVAVLFLAALLVILLPENVERIAGVMTRSSLLSLGIGVLTITLFGMALLLSAVLAFICIGVPLAIVLVVAFMLSMLMGWVAAGKVVGQKLVQVLHITNATPLGATLLGVLVLTLLSRVVGLGWLLGFLVSSWGIGATVLTRFGTLSYPSLEPFGMHGSVGGGPLFATPTPPSAPSAPAQPQAPSPAQGWRRPDTRPLNDQKLPNDDRPQS